MAQLVRQVIRQRHSRPSRVTNPSIQQNTLLPNKPPALPHLVAIIITMYKSQSVDPSHIDNFSVRSKASDSVMVEPKEERIRQRERTQDRGRPKQFLINGVDFHAGEIVVHRQGEVLEDAFSVKGDYFYLKKGEIVNVRFAIGEYVEIRFEQKVGYFPACLIRLIAGERWRTK